MLFELFRQQEEAGDMQFIILGIAGELDHLHAVAQCVGNRVEQIGGGDEHHFGQIERHFQVMVAEGEVLLGVEHFQQRRGGVAAEILADFIHFVHHKDRVFLPRAFHAVHDASGQRADIGTPVAANLPLVAHAAQRDAHELASHRPRNRAPDGGFPHPRRSHEAEDGAFHLRIELTYGQILEDAFFRFG